MDKNIEKIKDLISNNKEKEIVELLRNRCDPNFGNGCAIRMAARYGLPSIVKLFIQHGGNPHILSETGASTLQLAVFSGMHWDSNSWLDLLSCCDPSELAEGAATAIVFNNVAALAKILQTARCNTNMPTVLTGKTVEELAKDFKIQYMLNTPVIKSNQPATPDASLRERSSRTSSRSNHLPVLRNLSPSVARFFDLTANQPLLTPPHSPIRSLLSPQPKPL